MAKTKSSKNEPANEVKKNPGGRPSKYSKELAEKICLMVSTRPHGLERICKENPEFPCPETIYDWKITKPEFSKMYAQAKANQADLLVEEILNISDDSSNDYYEDKEGNEKFNAEHVNRSRLRVDTRKWIACKLLPKVYGDKVQTESTVTVKTHEERLKELE
jgi:hypothetical protein